MDAILKTNIEHLSALGEPAFKKLSSKYHQYIPGLIPNGYTWKSLDLFVEAFHVLIQFFTGYPLSGSMPNEV